MAGAYCEQRNGAAFRDVDLLNGLAERVDAAARSINRHALISNDGGVFGPKALAASGLPPVGPDVGPDTKKGPEGPFLLDGWRSGRPVSSNPEWSQDVPQMLYISNTYVFFRLARVP